MKQTTRHSLIGVALAVLASGCAETNFPDATGEGRIRGIAAIPDAPELFFLIEERLVGNVDYTGVAGFETYDDLSYNFNFDYALSGDIDPTRIATQAIDVVDGVEYTVIITGTLDNPTLTLWEDEQREWGDTETVLEPFFTNFATSLGSVDVYLLDEGTTPVLGSELGTIAPGERLAPGDIESGNYEIVFTVPDDPATILYTSGLINALPRSRPLFALFDPTAINTAPSLMTIISEGGQSTPVADENFPGQFRFYHASPTVGNVDLYLDNDFSTPFASDVAYGDLVPYLDATSITPILTATAVGNSGAVVLENTLVTPLGERRTIALIGDMAEPNIVTLENNGRPLSVSPIIRVVNLSATQDFVNIYLQDPGTEITETTFAAFAGIPPFFDTAYFGRAEGMIEMTVTNFASIEPVAPPIVFGSSIGDVIDIAIIETVDPDELAIDVYSTQ